MDRKEMSKRIIKELTILLEREKEEDFSNKIFNLIKDLKSDYYMYKKINYDFLKELYMVTNRKFDFRKFVTDEEKEEIYFNKAISYQKSIDDGSFGHIISKRIDERNYTLNFLAKKFNVSLSYLYMLKMRMYVANYNKIIDEKYTNKTAEIIKFLDLWEEFKDFHKPRNLQDQPALLGKKVDQMQLIRGMTTVNLSDLMNINQVITSRIRYSRYCTHNVTKSLSKALGTDIEYFMFKIFNDETFEKIDDDREYYLLYRKCEEDNMFFCYKGYKEKEDSTVYIVELNNKEKLECNEKDFLYIERIKGEKSNELFND